MKLIPFTVCLLSAIPLQGMAEIVLPDIVGDNMVLQQNTEASLWGWSDGRDEVVVSASWNPDLKVTARPDSKTGKWSVKLPTPAATFEPQQILIKSGKDTRQLENVLVGEVWLCSGQSNMEMPLRGFWTQPVEGAAQAIAYSGTYPGIRFATVPKSASYTPEDRVESPWKISSPKNAYDFSALAYFFATSLTRLLDAPVGIINCSYGGSKVEGWQSKEALANYPEWDVEKERNDSTINEWERINVMYNAMLHPIAGYTVKGFLWNQGESNVGRHDTYPSHLRDMVVEWRGLWGDDNLPFYYVEIPGWNYSNPDAIDAALFRECQHKAVGMISNSGIVCTADLVYPYEVNDIHARKKQEIGERLAFMAGGKAYGIEGMPTEYPTFRSMTVEDGKAILSFDNADGGFTPNTELEGFEAAGNDGVFHPARAIENPQTLNIEVTCEEVPEIKNVRYNFHNFRVGTVYNILGLPLIPFRTDKD